MSTPRRTVDPVTYVDADAVASAGPDVSGGLPPGAALAASAAGGFVVGGLTQLGQTHLPDALHPLANSGAPWVLIAFGLALLARTVWVACLCGALALVGLEMGYVVIAAMRGFPSAPSTVAFWLTAGVVFGPLAGMAGYYLRARRATLGAVGGGLVAGIVSGEGLAAYLTVRDTSEPAYWIGQMAVGAIVLALVVRRTGSLWATVAFAVGVAGLLATRHVPMFGS